MIEQKMDYYETLRLPPDSDIAVFAATVQTLRKQVARVKKTLADERNNAQRLEGRIKGLKAQAGESLTGGKNSFEGFRSSLTKLSRQLDTSVEITRSLADEILPKLTSELTLSETNLSIKLGVYVTNSRQVANDRINELLRACITEREEFLSAFAKIYADFGLILYVNNEQLCPGIWRSDEVEILKRRLGMGEPVLTHDAPAEGTGTPQSVQDGQTPVEPAGYPFRNPGLCC